MVKKYIIGIDTNLHIGRDIEFKTFMFTKKRMYDTIEEAEIKIKEKIEGDNSNLTNKDEPVYYTIIPIYTKA
jgi:hypothetical protein